MQMSYSLKLIDLKTDSYEATFGTCELCMGTGVHIEEHMIFETSEGKIIDMENGFWCWGDYFTLLDVDNTADFAYWLSTQEFEGDAPQDESDMQENITLIGDKYGIYCRECEAKNKGYEIFDIEFFIELQSDVEIAQDDILEDEYFSGVLDIDGVDELDNDGLVNSIIYPYSYREGGGGYTFQISGEGFTAKGKKELISLTKKLCSITRDYAENRFYPIEEMELWWVEDETNKRITLNSNEVYLCCEKEDPTEFILKKMREEIDN